MGEFPVDPAVLAALDWHQDGLDSERKQAVAEAIDGLEPELRDVVNGLFWENVSKQEMARRCNVSRFEIDRRLKEAIRALGEILDDV